MKKIGLIGGVGCGTTSLYYKIITQQISKRLGPRQSGNIIIYSVNEYDAHQAAMANDWSTVGEIILSAEQQLEKTDVDFIILCSNTCHKVVPAIQPHFKKEFIHILVPIGKEIIKNKYDKIAVFGTKFVATPGFYLDYLQAETNKQFIIPNENEVDIIHNVIMQELLLGIIKNESRDKLLEIWENLKRKGADCLLLGCTELSLLISENDISSPLLDSTKLHAIYAANHAIGFEEK